ncbi:MAG: hypothetical protein ACT6UL_14815 [Sphingopyxis sp.]
MIGATIGLAILVLFFACAVHGEVRSARAIRQQNEMMRRESDGCDCWACRP